MGNINVQSQFDLALAIVKDKACEEIARNFRESYTSLLEAEVESRRIKKRSLILSMAKLKNALYNFEMTYALVKKDCGTIDGVDSYISDLKKKIRELSALKNRPLSE